MSHFQTNRLSAGSLVLNAPGAGLPKGIILGAPFPRTVGSNLAAKVCDLCGQPASRIHPTLCAECYYKYWEKASRGISRMMMTVW